MLDVGGCRPCECRIEGAVGPRSCASMCRFPLPTFPRNGERGAETERQNTTSVVVGSITAAVCRCLFYSSRTYLRTVGRTCTVIA